MHYVVAYHIPDEDDHHCVFTKEGDALKEFEHACQCVLHNELISLPKRGSVFINGCHLFWSAACDAYEAKGDVLRRAAEEIDSYRFWNDRRCANIEF